MSSAAVELDLVIEAVRHSFPLAHLALPNEFYPAHLSVALIDAVFRSRGKHNDGTVPAAEQYCRRFGIARTRKCRWDSPSPEDQETLTDLIGRFDELGMGRMIGEIIRTDRRHPGAMTARGDFVLCAARELRRAGIEVLQEFQAPPREEIERALRGCAGFGATATRMLLMYASNDDFVRGDRHVCRFVAHALGRMAVSATRAENLVRSCAYELILSPRYLYHQIWRHRSAWQMDANGHAGGRIRTTGAEWTGASTGGSNGPQVDAR